MLHGNFPEIILDKTNANVYSDKDHLAKLAKFGSINKDRKNVKFVNLLVKVASVQLPTVLVVSKALNLIQQPTVAFK